MTWDFETDPEFQRELDWVDEFMRVEVEPLDHLVHQPADLRDPVRQKLIPPLQQRVRERGLWACHLPPRLGGSGYGQLKLALLNEIIGRSHCGPFVFGCHGPDSGNAEILAEYGSERLKQLYLEPLLRNDIASAYSMTELQGGSDPKEFQTTAVLDGDEWVITGQKWFSTYASFATFLVVMAVTDPDLPPAKRMSMFVVPAHTPGVRIIRDVGLIDHADGEGTHSFVAYDDVRVPADHLLGGRGEAATIAQTRLGGARIHHAMRTIGLVRRAFDAMCERVLSRRTQGEPLASKQLVQAMIADSWIQMEQFRLLVLQTAWKIDRYQDYGRVRADISAVKAVMPQVLHDVAARALQLHGSLGATNEMPFGSMVLESFYMGLVDGPTEIHKTGLARQLLKDYRPTSDLFPTTHIPKLRADAYAKHAEALADSGDDRPINRNGRHADTALSAGFNR